MALRPGPRDGRPHPLLAWLRPQRRTAFGSLTGLISGFVLTLAIAVVFLGVADGEPGLRLSIPGQRGGANDTSGSGPAVTQGPSDLVDGASSPQQPVPVDGPLAGPTTADGPTTGPGEDAASAGRRPGGSGHAPVDVIPIDPDDPTASLSSIPADVQPTTPESSSPSTSSSATNDAEPAPSSSPDELTTVQASPPSPGAAG